MSMQIERDATGSIKTMKAAGCHGGSDAAQPDSRNGFSDNKAPNGGYGARGNDGQIGADADIFAQFLAAMDGLPRDLQSKVIAALHDLDEASRSGNAAAESDAAARMATLVGEIQQARAADAVAKAAFTEPHRKHWGSSARSIFDGLRKRAGVGIDPEPPKVA